MKSYLLSVLIVSFFQVTFSGEWRGELVTGEKRYRVQYQFMFIVEGSKVSGTIRYWDEQSLAGPGRPKSKDFVIGEGEISGNRIRFAQMETNADSTVKPNIFFEGDLQGGEIYLTRTEAGAPTTTVGLRRFDPRPNQ